MLALLLLLQVSAVRQLLMAGGATLSRRGG